jgi:hypothetical protein
MLESVLAAILGLLFQISAVSSLMPIFILTILVASAICIIVGGMYTRMAVLLKRLSAASQSLVFSHFADTLAELPIIRARVGMNESFGEDLSTKLKVWSATAEANLHANR